MDEKKALQFLNDVKNENLRKHMVAVAAIMKKLASMLGEDEETWYYVGLLHDIDYEHVDMREHGIKSAEMLRGLLPEDALHAIMAHNEMTGVEAKTKLDYALIASDAISGLIVASALVMPDKKLKSVTVKTLKNKFKDKSFARRVDRGKIMYCEKIGFNIEQFFEIALEAMKGVANQLGL